MRHRPPRGHGNEPDTTPRAGEIYLEYQQVGQAMRVTAVDAATGVEVVIMGPVSASHHDLQEVAVRKLKARLASLKSE